MRSWSSLVFGSPYRLPVAALAAAAAPHELYAGFIADRVGTDRKEARRLLANLEQANLLVAAAAPAGPRPQGKPPRYLARCDEDFWRLMEQLATRYRRTAP